jgi:hypothetical protein
VLKYICMEDIENLAAQGKKELVVDENTVLMDLARDMAHQLGIAIVDGSRPAPVKVVPAGAPSSPAKAAAMVPPAPSGREAAPRLGAKPKGCQHGTLPVVAARQEQPKTHPNTTDGLVDQLVEVVRQSTGKRSGN